MASNLIETAQNSDFPIISSDKEQAQLLQSKDVCRNCGTHLSGKFCHGCGQPSRSIIKFFGQVVMDVLDDVIGYDSRLKHTIMPLLFKPGKITNDYIKGKVFHYVLPVRLYLILSVVCILMVQAVIDPKKMITDDVSFSNDNQSQQEIDNELDKAQKIMDESGLAIDVRSKIEAKKPKKEVEVKGAPLESEAQKNQQDLTDKMELDKEVKIVSGAGYFNFEYDDETEAFVFEGDFYKDYPQAKSAVVDIHNKSKSWKQDPTPLVNQLFELFPWMMFAILPIFAIVLKFTYIFKKRFYVEHLVFCLHNHCFIYFALILEILLGLLEESLAKYDFWLADFLAQLTSYLSIGLAFWIVIYIGIALKRVYRQGWFFTLSKMMFLSLIYFSFLLFGFLTTLIIGAWQA